MGFGCQTLPYPGVVPKGNGVDLVSSLARTFSMTAALRPSLGDLRNRRAKCVELTMDRIRLLR